MLEAPKDHRTQTRHLIQDAAATRLELDYLGHTGTDHHIHSDAPPSQVMEDEDPVRTVHDGELLF